MLDCSSNACWVGAVADAAPEPSAIFVDVSRSDCLEACSVGLKICHIFESALNSPLAPSHSGSANRTNNAPSAANETTHAIPPISVRAPRSNCSGGGGGGSGLTIK